jgi:hypothetical protein
MRMLKSREGGEVGMWEGGKVRRRKGGMGGEVWRWRGEWREEKGRC